LLARAQGFGALTAGEVSLMLAFRDRDCVPAFHVDVKVIFIGIDIDNGHSVLAIVALDFTVAFGINCTSWCRVAARLADALSSLAVRCYRLLRARY
jgi:hypothetical protein